MNRLFQRIPQIWAALLIPWFAESAAEENFQIVEMENPADFKSPLFVGIDVGGTNIKFGIVDERGNTLSYRSLPTQAEGNPRHSLSRVGNELQVMLKELGLNLKAISRVGLGTPGTMDIPAGLILDPPNLPGWRQFPIRQELSDLLGIPVTFSNDANAAAYGEYWIGSGKKHRSIVMLTLGTGVGGGIIINGRSIEGETGHGSECGHIMIDTSETARVCSCGIKGHLEAYASATALVQRAKEILETDEKSILRNATDHGRQITGLDIAMAVEKGDPLASRLMIETADYLAIGVAIFLNTIDPSAVVLGGAMNFGGENNPAGRMFINRVRRTSGTMALPVVAENASIIFAELGGDAGYIGAAGLAREDYLTEQRG